MTNKEILTEYILKELAEDHELNELDENESLLESGIIDSMDIIRLLAFLETEFKLKVLDEELLPENFNTVSSILALIDKKQKSLKRLDPT